MKSLADIVIEFDKQLLGSASVFLDFALIFTFTGVKIWRCKKIRSGLARDKKNNSVADARQHHGNVNFSSHRVAHPHHRPE